MENQPAIPFDTATAAYALSRTIVAEAKAHVDSMLSSETWLLENRKVWHPSGEWAFWDVTGNTLLSLPERHQLRNYYLKSGWAKVEYLETPHARAGAWSLRFYL